MLELTALCSNEDCAEEITVHVEGLDELDRFMCECDCTLVLLRAADVTFA
jgi:hypothetical protein